MAASARVLAALVLGALGGVFALSSAWVEEPSAEPELYRTESWRVAGWELSSTRLPDATLLDEPTLPMVHCDDFDYVDLGPRIVALGAIPELPNLYADHELLKPVDLRLFAATEGELLLASADGVWSLPKSADGRSEGQVRRRVVWPGGQGPVALGDDQVVRLDEDGVTLAALDREPGPDQLQRIALEPLQIQQGLTIDRRRESALWVAHRDGGAQRGSQILAIDHHGQDVEIIHHDAVAGHRILAAAWADKTVVFTLAVERADGPGEVRLLRTGEAGEPELLQTIRRDSAELTMVGDGTQAWLQIRGDRIWWVSAYEEAIVRQSPTLDWLTGQPGRIAWVEHDEDTAWLNFVAASEHPFRSWDRTMFLSPQAPSPAGSDGAEVPAAGEGPWQVSARSDEFPAIYGELEADLVQRIFTARARDLEPCLSGLARDEIVWGSISMRLVIGPDGHVEQAESNIEPYPEIPRRRLRKAMSCPSSTAAKRWRFPEPGDGRQARIGQEFGFHPSMGSEVMGE